MEPAKRKAENRLSQIVDLDELIRRGNQRITRSKAKELVRNIDPVISDSGSRVRDDGDMGSSSLFDHQEDEEMTERVEALGENVRGREIETLGGHSQVRCRDDEGLGGSSQSRGRDDDVLAGGSQLVAREDEIFGSGTQSRSRGDDDLGGGTQSRGRDDDVLAGGSQLVAREDEIFGSGTQSRSRGDDDLGGGTQSRGRDGEIIGNALQSRFIIDSVGRADTGQTSVVDSESRQNNNNNINDTALTQRNVSSNRTGRNSNTLDNDEFIAQQDELCNLNYSPTELLEMANRDNFPERVFLFGQKYKNFTPVLHFYECRTRYLNRPSESIQFKCKVTY
jgi:hypothetical protein